MNVMKFKEREKRNEKLVVRALHYISKTYLENFDVKFNRTIQNALHFESLFLCEGIAQ